ncbi:polysaccharide deacetylase family protein [Planosporangium thailandense]|uniref:Polysaccharide deacetylase family protein n=2 Tax=Planosporangium thailandense TaxID=765197 RepID=A0ABX0Y396_9ACTN|nr:polysaccharide deacetylase family protein [Planosporangium thailandense]NJC72551.1 polysaccharide deacetylase family protein [Planosporangium thailandense]
MAGCADHPAATWVNPATNPSGSPSATTIAGGEIAKELTHGPRDKPAVALTFHGDGDEAQVRALLDELEQGGAKVTVLAVGRWLEAQPAMAKRILDGGHELGNHTQNHLDIATMSPSDALAEISACAAVLQRLTGSIGKWFRPSQTRHATDMILAQAAQAGYPVCLSYDVDSLDFADPDPSTVLRAVTDTIGNGSIVSMHFGHAATIAAMPELLNRLRDKGLRAVTMSDLVS